MKAHLGATSQTKTNGKGSLKGSTALNGDAVISVVVGEEKGAPSALTKAVRGPSQRHRDAGL